MIINIVSPQKSCFKCIKNLYTVINDSETV